MPHQVEADEFHALSRDLFDDLVHQLPPILDAAMQTHGLAAGLEMASRTCDHVPCLRDRIKVLASAAAFAAITERARRDGQPAPDLSAYTASEGGGFE